MAKKEKEVKAPLPKNREEAIAQIIKKYGDGSVVMAGSQPVLNVPAISTGSLGLDMALGVGGVPRGRIIELYGPEGGGKTTLSLCIIREAQRAGGQVAFVDAEHALDLQWARNIGVDLDNLIISQPDSGEQALNIVEDLVSSRQFDVIVVDSVAALIPKVEIDGEIGDVTIGAQARMMSQAMRKLAGVASKSKCAVLFINQIRMKIGVMYGCLHGDTLINFVDGRALPIKEVVDNMIGGKVWGYDLSSNKFIASEIINWHNNGDVDTADEYLSISVVGPGNKNGAMNIVVTRDHKVLTDNGWTSADDLMIGSRIVTKQESINSGTLGGFLRGVLSGDSHIGGPKGNLSSILTITDNIDSEYMEWKVNKLSALQFTRYGEEGRRRYMSKPFSELTDLKHEYPSRDPMLLLNDFDPCGFAVWIMDDACYNRGRYVLSIKRFKGNFEKIEQISRALDGLGLYHYASEGGHITFDKGVSDKIASMICEFVPPCMSHKLPAGCQLYKDFELSRENEYSTTYAVVTGIRTASGRQMRSKGKYDITVAGTECYSAGGSANGVIVHNSPEQTTGGKALKYYSSVRMDIRRNAAIKEGDTTVGFLTTVKVVKNKVAPPFRQAEFSLFFGMDGYPYGIDTASSVVDLALELDIVGKAGTWFTYGEVRLGNGKQQVSQFLRSNPETLKEIEAKVRKAYSPDLIATKVAEDDEPEKKDAEE